MRAYPFLKLILHAPAPHIDYYWVPTTATKHTSRSSFLYVSYNEFSLRFTSPIEYYY